MPASHVGDPDLSVGIFRNYKLSWKFICVVYTLEILIINAEIVCCCCCFPGMCRWG